MPKRCRAESTAAPVEHDIVDILDSVSTIPPIIVPEDTAMDSRLDPLLEEQLSALEVDDDFKDSIRAMTPNTRRDVLNDIIRHQMHVNISEGLHIFDDEDGDDGRLRTALRGGPRGRHGRFRASDAALESEDSSLEDGSETEEEEEEEEVEEEEDAIQRDDTAGDEVRWRPARSTHPSPPFWFPGAASRPSDDAGGPQVRVFGAGSGPSIADIMELFAISSMREARYGDSDGSQQLRGDGNVSRQNIEDALSSLRTLLGAMHQANIMTSMGLDRDVDEMTYEELLELEERIGNVSKGVPPALLESCMTPLRELTGEAGSCAICQEELSASAHTQSHPSRTSATSPAAGEKACVRLLNCPHTFHKPCIQQWLGSNKTCPICKAEVLPGAADASS